MFTYLFQAFAIVYRRKNYVWLAGLVALFLFILNGMFHNFGLYFHYSSPKLWYYLWMGSLVSLPLRSVISTALISMLTGLLVPLVVYQIKELNDRRSHIAGSGGILLGLIAPACSSCGIGLVALLGLAGVFSGLPFNGFEISILSIVLLVWAIFLVSKKIAVKTCIPQLKLRGKNI